MTTKKWPPNHNGHVKINLSKVTRGFFYDCPKWGLLYSNFRLAKPFFLLMKLDYNHNSSAKLVIVILRVRLGLKRAHHI